jgi:hypothetical protein
MQALYSNSNKEVPNPLFLFTKTIFGGLLEEVIKRNIVMWKNMTVNKMICLMFVGLGGLAAVALCFILPMLINELNKPSDKIHRVEQVR